jgi:hypothetical protein
MKARSRIAWAVVVCLLLAAAAVPTVRWLNRDTSFSFSVCDTVSGRWVWKASMVLQGRVLDGYFQSTAGLRRYRFTHLTPGAAVLEISAPDYQAVRLPLTLHRGANVRPQPIAMTGLQIPGLSQFVVFERIEAGDIVAELRPVSATGAAIVNHPCLDLWVGARVSVQMRSGLPSQEAAQDGVSRGKVLFRGPVAWSWDSAPETVFRYSARIPAVAMAQDPSPIRVIDYLIVEPDPRSLDHKELAALMDHIYGLADPQAMTAALDREKGRLHYFTETSWNVTMEGQQ